MVLPCPNLLILADHDSLTSMPAEWQLPIYFASYEQPSGLEQFRYNKLNFSCVCLVLVSSGYRSALKRTFTTFIPFNNDFSVDPATRHVPWVATHLYDPERLLLKLLNRASKWQRYVVLS